ncbi:LacI family DNA-binding transcriptional regulator [Planctomicrobium sp. SH661]|uniref:LacI family DNA-binding transcriptional regulator n=1 Tax=Planctomicrobium sp. SH661 TaxID=3448124 RepID=UPI003F5B871F
MSDVAHAAGVSVSTASRALNGLASQNRISESTAQLVKDAAKQLGFRPSEVARSLRSRRTGLLGIIVPDLSNPFFSAITRAVTISIESAGFSTVMADSDGSVNKERDLIDQMISRNVESLVVCPVGLEFQHLELASKSGLPLIVVDRCCVGSSMVQVTSDHLEGARLAMKVLLQNGHRQIGILRGLPGTLPCDLRLQGAQMELKEVREELDPAFVAGDQFTFESGYQSARQLLTQSPEITALFAMSTPNALGAIRAAAEMGRRIPEDLSLISFDDIAFAEFMQVPLTTIVQDVPELGRRAAELVIEELQSKTTTKKRTHKIPVRLVSRASVGRVLQ